MCIRDRRLTDVENGFHRIASGETEKALAPPGALDARRGSPDSGQHRTKLLGLEREGGRALRLQNAGGIARDGRAEWAREGRFEAVGPGFDGEDPRNLHEALR